MKLLCLSNGHGEDAIAVRILEQLQQQFPKLKLAALPIVGEGLAYQSLDVPIIGAVKQMPSGGFIYMDGRQFWRDVKGGLLRLTWEQLRAIRHWAKDSTEPSFVLAVGDLVPLLFAGLSGTAYAFVGTAKSEYYLRDEQGWLSEKTKREGWSGSVYYPWERWLMSRKRCKAVFPRDTLTSKILQKNSVPAFDLGNPMMDGLGGNPQPMFYNPRGTEEEEARSLTILLLPGSRSPEAYENWQLILTAVGETVAHFRDREILFLAAIAPTLNLDPCVQSLQAEDWQFQTTPSKSLPISDPDALVFGCDRATLLLSQTAYAQCLQAADFAIAMAGTATEQFIGLGKPAIALPGDGPQYTYAFAEAQSRHLGASLTLLKRPRDVPRTLQALLNDPDRLQLITDSGRQRMGQPGAAARIAECLTSLLKDEG